VPPLPLLYEQVVRPELYDLQPSAFWAEAGEIPSPNAKSPAAAVVIAPLMRVFLTCLRVFIFGSPCC
jgi:hypothetical protein